MGDHRRNGFYWFGGTFMTLGAAIFAGWYIAVSTGAVDEGLRSVPTLVALSVFGFGALLVLATMGELIPRKNRKAVRKARKKGAKQTGVASWAVSAFDPITPRPNSDGPFTGRVTPPSTTPVTGPGVLFDENEVERGEGNGTAISIEGPAQGVYIMRSKFHGFDKALEIKNPPEKPRWWQRRKKPK